MKTIHRKARKPHKCEKCCGIIQPGEIYEINKIFPFCHGESFVEFKSHKRDCMPTLWMLPAENAKHVMKECRKGIHSFVNDYKRGYGYYEPTGHLYCKWCGKEMGREDYLD